MCNALELRISYLHFSIFPDACAGVYAIGKMQTIPFA
jgi:hypothetical protein